MDPRAAAAEELRRAVEQAAAGTPYAVTATDRGFDVGLDVVDAQWYGLFNKAGLSRTIVHHVEVREDRTYSITDDVRSLEWVAGVPRVAFTASRQVGRVITFGRQKTWAFDEQGRFGPVVDYRFDSEEGRELVAAVAGRLGLQQRRGSAERVGLWFAIVGGVGALVTLVVLGVLALLGTFS